MGTLHMGKDYLLAIFTSVCDEEGNRATSPFSETRDGSINASRLSLEAQMECDFMLLEGEAGHFAHGKKNYLLVLFAFVRGTEGDRATSPSSTSRNGLIPASSLSLEVQMEREFILLEGEARHFAHGKNYLLAILSFFHDTEGDEATSPSFVSENTAIDATRSWLEALGAS